jgi:hypothetical protein
MNLKIDKKYYPPTASYWQTLSSDSRMTTEIIYDPASAGLGGVNKIYKVEICSKSQAWLRSKLTDDSRTHLLIGPRYQTHGFRS